MSGSKVERLLGRLEKMEDENGQKEEEDRCLGKHDICVYHPIIRSILTDMKANSNLKWKVLLGIVPMFLGLIAISGVFYSASSDKVVNELQRIRYELIQNQESMKTQIDKNTVRVAEYGVILSRVERDMEKIAERK